MVKSLPAMWETWVHSLGWEDPLEKPASALANTKFLIYPPPRLFPLGNHKAVLYVYESLNIQLLFISKVVTLAPAITVTFQPEARIGDGEGSGCREKKRWIQTCSWST